MSKADSLKSQTRHLGAMLRTVRSVSAPGSADREVSEALLKHLSALTLEDIGVKAEGEQLAADIASQTAAEVAGEHGEQASQRAG